MAPPPQTAPTILSLKQSFLTTQTRLLSQPPEPSRAWRRGNNDDHASNEQGLSQKAVDDALYHLNHTIQQHARRVYALQATRHVAEQIDQLYLSVGEQRSGGGGEDGDGEELDGEDAWKIVGADYADPTVVSNLPSTWDSDREATAYPLEAKRYADLTTRLQDLAARKTEVEARVQRLRRIKALLEPFSLPSPSREPTTQAADSPMGGVQENLVTRDGEVEKELERMRILLVRVADKVARLREREGTTGTEDEDDELFGDGEAMAVDDVDVMERNKVQRLLDGMR